MKIFSIETCAFGTYWAQDVDCPISWRGSGCYDVEYECVQEATFEVAAETLGDALKLISGVFEKYNTNYDYTLYSIYYDPNTVTEKEDEDDGKAEVFDYNYSEPECGESKQVPERYSEDISEYEEEGGKPC